MNRLWQYLQARWLMTLGVLAALLALLNVAAFYPGFMSNDSVDQLAQARGDRPLTDWHPPIMALLWRFLLLVSGDRVGSMLIVQCAVLWLALAVLAVYVYRRTQSEWLSLLPLAIGLMPFVINLSGVIWKDVQMAVALLLATVLLVLAPRLKAWYLYGCMALAGLAIVYAVNVRYNAVAAVIPLLWLVWRTIDVSKLKYGFIGGVVVVALLLMPVVSLLRPATATHPISSMMLDDVVHIYNTKQIAELQLAGPAQQALLNVSRRCETKQIPVSVWIACADEKDLEVLSRTHYEELKSAWVKAVVHHPLKYASYRLGQYGVFLAPKTSAQAYVWHEGVVPNPYGITAASNLVTNTVAWYVERLSFDLGFLFRPYVWLLAGTLCAAGAWRCRRTWDHAPYIMAISLSAVLYILSYIPVVAAYDFRYSYWAGLAVCVALVLIVIDSGVWERVSSFKMTARENAKALPKARSKAFLSSPARSYRAKPRRSRR